MAKCVALIQGSAVAGQIVSGVLRFEQASESAPTVIDGFVQGLAPVGLDGLRRVVVIVMVCGAMSHYDREGGIFNPFGKAHGAPDDDERNVGDLGNIEANDEGRADIHIEDRQVKLIGPHSVIGRSIIIKEREDDLGRGGHELSLTTGNCGTRIAGGVIGIAQS